MKESIIDFIKSTPILKLKSKADYYYWNKNARPLPPPHIVKQKALAELSSDYNLEILVETGTFKGDMLFALKNNFSKLYSIELSEQLFLKAKNKFKRYQHIHLIHGDSSNEIPAILNKLTLPTLFWLDGHYSSGITAKGQKEVPIIEELTHILSSNLSNYVIAIDDARLFGTDPSYPTMDELQSVILNLKPQSKIENKNDIVRIKMAS